MYNKHVKTLSGVCFILFNCLCIFAEEPPDLNIQNAWIALNSKNYAQADALSGQIINSLKEKQDNNFVTALFIQAEIARITGNNKVAIEKFSEILKKITNDTKIWDINTKEWVSADELCKDRIKDIKEGDIFGCYTSEDLMINTWKMYGVKNYANTERCALKCIKLYEKLAEDEQKSLKELPSKKDIDKYGYLNHVGTCEVLLGEIFRETGRIEQAKKQYKRVIEHYSYAQCWDPRGWLWKVSDLAKDRLLAIENDVDWYNSSSENLTQNTWKYYGEDDYKKAEFFAKKCIDLYLESAKQQQKEITKMPQANFIPYYWAVNDVGTCCFILGEIYTKQNKISDAVKMFETVVNDIYYSQCWDPKGWYWQVAAVCRDRLNKIVNYKNE